MGLNAGLAHAGFGFDNPTDDLLPRSYEGKDPAVFPMNTTVVPDGIVCGLRRKPSKSDDERHMCNGEGQGFA